MNYLHISNTTNIARSNDLLAFPHISLKPFQTTKIILSFSIAQSHCKKERKKNERKKSFLSKFHPSLPLKRSDEPGERAGVGANISPVIYHPARAGSRPRVAQNRNPGPGILGPGELERGELWRKARFDPLQPSLPRPHTSQSLSGGSNSESIVKEFED